MMTGDDLTDSLGTDAKAVFTGCMLWWPYVESIEV